MLPALTRRVLVASLALPALVRPVRAALPTTGAGCVALARFACEFTEDQGVPLDYENNDPVLALIARSPAL